MSPLRRLRLGLLDAANLALHAASKLRSVPDTPPRPIFIVGAPRTGSTALYQLLTHSLDIGYVDNLAAQFYGDLPLGVALSRLRYGKAPHHSFSSDLGSTVGGGGHAPNEVGPFWYRWLPREEHFIEAEQVPPASKRHLLQQVSGAERASGASRFLFKNLNAGQRLRLIHDVFPGASVIWCRRGHAETCASVIRARRQLEWPPHSLWSIRPTNWRDLEGLPEAELVDRQIRAIEDQIALDIGLFPAGQRRLLSYDEWRRDPLGTVKDLQSFLDIPRRPGIADSHIRELPIR